MSDTKASFGRYVIRDVTDGRIVDDTPSAVSRPLKAWEIRSVEHEPQTQRAISGAA